MQISVSLAFTHYQAMDYVFPHHNAVVMLEFESSNYTVDEANGFVEVCSVLIGQTERSVNASLQTADDIAVGECVRVKLMHYNYLGNHVFDL